MVRNKGLILLAIIISLVFAFSSYAEETDSESIAVQREQLAFEKEKWEYEKNKEEKERFEAQFPTRLDFKRDIPTYEFVGYVSDTERQELLKILTILEENDYDTLIINISSFGGSAFDGMGVADTIQTFKQRGFNIVGRAYGKICSAAVPIFASCSERISGRSTVFMIHEASIFKFFTQESKSDIESQQEMMEKLESRYIDMLVRNSSKSSEFWEQAIKQTTWFTADEALEWGIIDRIE